MNGKRLATDTREAAPISLNQIRGRRLEAYPESLLMVPEMTAPSDVPAVDKSGNYAHRLKLRAEPPRRRDKMPKPHARLRFALSRGRSGFRTFRDCSRPRFSLPILLSSSASIIRCAVC
jgi:hypothetical protein